MFGLIYLRCPVQYVNVSRPSFKWWTFVLLFLSLSVCTIFQTLFIGVWQFNLETKLRQEVRRFCFSVLQAFALTMRKLSTLSDVGCFPNRRSAFLWFLMASLQSSLNHGFPGCFGFVEVFGIVSSAIDITVWLNFKIESVEFRIISVWSFSLHICSYRGVSFVKFIPCRSFTYSRM